MIRAHVPSNIAFVKYWGKSDEKLQWPANDSLSMTLETSATVTDAALSSDTKDSVVLNNSAVDATREPKVFRFLDFLRDELSFDSKLKIRSQNTFPTGCGIASSASGYAALTLAAVAAWSRIDSYPQLLSEFGLQKLSDLARRGSGSACRSLAGGFVHWRRGNSPAGQEIEQVFYAQELNLANLIIIVSDQQKHLSSSEGHQIALSSPKFKERLPKIPARIAEFKKALASNNFLKFAEIVELEADELHEICLTSDPSVEYWAKKTYEIIEEIKRYRDKTRVNVAYTLDAGPNIHLICRDENKETVFEHVQRSFPEVKVLRDRMGHGPTLQGVAKF